MTLSGNTVFITGGSSGIGMALAERFLKLGNEVIICGRREDALSEMKKKHPTLHTLVGDTGSAKDRERLAKTLTQDFPKLNVLINNAGIQRRVNLTEAEEWRETQQEIAVNLEGPIHLTSLFLPHLLKQAKPVVMNVSSGLAFMPLTAAPIYCATKAALHSYTLSLRYQLAKTPVKVVEIIPPAVRTNLGGSHDFGAPLAEFADSILEQLGAGAEEATYDTSAIVSRIGRDELNAVFRRMNP